MDVNQVRQLMEEQLKLSSRLRARIRELEEARHAPLAVVGMGLRLPGDLRSPDEYWDFLRGEGTAVTDIPDDRPGLRAVYDPTPGRPGRSYVDRGAFLSDIAHFDADFFGISHREAELLDPQQRLLLETAWEALERAGIAVRRADRLNIGVFLGMMASEYGERLAVREDKTPIDPYYATGGGLCFGAGRISYVMGFCGPVVSVDTACSSSLVALHLAVRALRAGECKYALVCGSNLLLSGNLMVSLCQSRALAPDGRSKSFLASADGYGRGEGVGVLVLMRLDEAEQERRPIMAVVRGTAINHDGAASGLTVPNGPAQTEVIRSALADAGVAPEELGCIEAHGTGTPLGDPVEVGALDGALGEAVRRRGVPLAIGSVKSRLGHLEAASGIAGLGKAVLMLQHGEIPAAAGEDDVLNGHIQWDRLSFTVPRRSGPWPAALPRRVVGVNSFGMSGTNAHAVLEAYAPAHAPEPDPETRDELLTLSAKTPKALAVLAEAVAEYLRKADPDELPSICHTLRAGRAPFTHRLAFTGRTPSALAEQLAHAASALAEQSAPAPANPVSRPRTVTLRVASRTGHLDVALTHLARAFPRLAGVAADDSRDAPDRLAGIAGRLGVRMRLQRDDDLAGGTATFDWDCGDGSGTWSVPLVTGEPSTAPAVLLDALAALFVAGADMRLDDLCGPSARIVGDLPTYPFQRKRFWIDEPQATASVAASTASEPVTSSAVPAADDREAVVAYLMAELSSALRATDGLDPSLSFLEAGGDSFISTVFMTKIEEQFDIGLAPEDLPIELPLSVLVGTIADRIAEVAGGAGPEEHS